MLICKAKHLLYIYIYITKMGESTSKFDFERIVPVFLREPSRSSFCANRPGRIVPGRNWFLRETSRNPIVISSEFHDFMIERLIRIYNVDQKH